MKKGLTEIVFILDRSGSMAGLEKDTIGGFNAMLEKQRHGEGQALISTVLFSGESAVIHDRVDARDVSPLTERTTLSAAARRCWTPLAGPFITSATCTNTPARKTGPSARCLSSPPTAWKTPAAITTCAACGR